MFTPQLLVIALAVFVALMSIPALVSPKATRKAIKSYCGDENLIRVNGFLSLFFGLFFLSVHWKFTEGWFMIISIIGWIAVFKGIIRVWFPKYIKKMVKKYAKKSDSFIVTFGIIGVLSTIALLYIAFNLLTFEALFY